MRVKRKDHTHHVPTVDELAAFIMGYMANNNMTTLVCRPPEGIDTAVLHLDMGGGKDSEGYYFTFTLRHDNCDAHCADTNHAH